MKNPSLCGFVAVSALCSSLLPAQETADLTRLLPAATPVVLDLTDGAALVAKALALLDPLPKGVPAEARAVLMGLPLATRAATGRDLEDLLDTLTPKQVAFAVFPARQPFPVFLSRIEDAAEVRRIHQKLRKQFGKPLHYDIDADVLTVSDSAAHLRQVLRFRREGAATLHDAADFRKHRAAAKPGSSVRFYVDLQAVETLAQGKFFARLPDAAKVFFGPIVRAVDLAQRADGRLDVTDVGLALRGSLDAALGQDKVARLTAKGQAVRPLVAFPAGTLACVSLDRDFGEILRRPKDWLDQDGQLGVANFVSTADLLLGGASLMKDLVPNIDVPIDLFVTKNTPDEDAEQPRAKLPAFALTFGLGKEAKRVRRILERALVTVAAVANPDRLRAKKVPIRVRRGRREDYKFQFVSFGEYRGLGDPPLEHGLTPTLLFAHGRGILASTVDGAVRLADAIGKRETKPIRGDYAALRGAAIADLVRANLEVLSMDRVLKEGGTRKAATDFMNGLAAIVGALDLDARVRPEGSQTKVDLHLRRHDR